MNHLLPYPSVVIKASAMEPYGEVEVRNTTYPWRDIFALCQSLPLDGGQGFWSSGQPLETPGQLLDNMQRNVDKPKTNSKKRLIIIAT